MADTCKRDHPLGAATVKAGPDERANIYVYRDGRRACLRCTRAQWRRQWNRKAVARG